MKVSMGTNVILITVDCLRADHVGFGGYKISTTPFLDDLASESIVFEKAIVAGMPTYYSFPAILASRYPLAFGRKFIGLAKREPTLVSTLHNTGFRTAAFIAGNPYLSQHFNYHQDFDVFEDFHEYNQAASFSKLSRESTSGAISKSLKTRTNELARTLFERANATRTLYRELYFRYYSREMVRVRNGNLDLFRRYPSADIVVEKAIKWLQNVTDGQVFLWLHLMDPHYPFYPPAEALQALGYGEIDLQRMVYLNTVWDQDDVDIHHLRPSVADIVALYDGGVRWVDQQVCRLIEALKDLGKWDNTLFILVGDHGEEFLEHGGHYHHPEKLSQELIHVPLLLRQPSAKSPIRLSSPFSLLDLAPTLLSMQGIAPPDTFVGVSRWQGHRIQEDENPSAITEIVRGSRNPWSVEDRMGARLLAVQDERYKLVFDFSTGKEQLFDLLNDPAELTPVALNREASSLTKLFEVAREHLRMRPLNRARLNARLGYLRAR